MDTKNLITNICSYDANSLYPSSFASVPSKRIPYTNNKLYMPGEILKVVTDKVEIFKLLTRRDMMYIVTLKGHIDRKYLNEYINFLPIIRNKNIKMDEETLGSYMFNLMGIDPTKKTKSEKK